MLLFSYYWISNHFGYFFIELSLMYSILEFISLLQTNSYIRKYLIKLVFNFYEFIKEKMCLKLKIQFLQIIYNFHIIIKLKNL